MTGSSDTVATTVRMERDLWKRVRILAAREEKSAAQWIREAVALVADRVERSTSA